MSNLNRTLGALFLVLLAMMSASPPILSAQEIIFEEVTGDLISIASDRDGAVYRVHEDSTFRVSATHLFPRESMTLISNLDLSVLPPNIGDPYLRFSKLSCERISGDFDSDLFIEVHAVSEPWDSGDLLNSGVPTYEEPSITLIDPFWGEDDYVIFDLVGVGGRWKGGKDYGLLFKPKWTFDSDGVCELHGFDSEFPPMIGYTEAQTALFLPYLDAQWSRMALNPLVMRNRGFGVGLGYE